MKCKRVCRGSYTVEAAIIVPLLLMVFLMAMKMGLDLYTEISEMCEGRLHEEYWEVDSFYKYQIVDEVWND